MASVETTKVRRGEKLVGAYCYDALARRLQALGHVIAPSPTGPAALVALQNAETRPRGRRARSGRADDRRHRGMHGGVRRVPKVRAAAPGHAPGRYTLAEVGAAIARLVGAGELVEARRRRVDRAFVTDRAVRAERRILARMRAGRYRGRMLADAVFIESELASGALHPGPARGDGGHRRRPGLDERALEAIGEAPTSPPVVEPEGFEKLRADRTAVLRASPAAIPAAANDSNCAMQWAVVRECGNQHLRQAIGSFPALHGAPSAPGRQWRQSTSHMSNARSFFQGLEPRFTSRNATIAERESDVSIMIQQR